MLVTTKALSVIYCAFQRRDVIFCIALYGFTIVSFKLSLCGIFSNTLSVPYIMYNDLGGRELFALYYLSSYNDIC